MENTTRALDWNDEIKEESSFTLLPDGEYPFKVTNFERGKYEGGEKLPPCNKAIITIKVDDQIELKENFFLTTKTEGLLSAFFTSIGQKKKGEPLRMNWGRVIGSAGRVKIGKKTYNGNEYNEVKKWLSPDEPQATGGFTPGAF